MESNGGVGFQPAHGRSPGSDGTTVGRMPTAPWGAMVAWAPSPRMDDRLGVTAPQRARCPLHHGKGLQSLQKQENTVGDGFIPSRASEAATAKRSGVMYSVPTAPRGSTQTRRFGVPSIQERFGPRPAPWPMAVSGLRDRVEPRRCLLPADAEPVAAPAAADNCRTVARPITSWRGPIRLAPLAQGDMGIETPHAG
jgi:hypothetical protein